MDTTARDCIDDLLRAVRHAPRQLPIGELCAAHESGVDVSIESSGPGEAVMVYASPRPGARLAELSRREREVAALAASGCSNHQIAAELFISVATVKDHLHSIFRRAGFTSRAQLIAAWYGGLRDPSTRGVYPR